MNEMDHVTYSDGDPNISVVFPYFLAVTGKTFNNFFKKKASRDQVLINEIIPDEVAILLIPAMY